MTRWRHLLAGLAAAAWVAAATAQVSVQLSRSPALECLQPAGADASAPEYPFEQWKGQVPGRVKVQVEFTEPGNAPEVSTLEREGPLAFEQAVLKHVKAWRVPCMEPGRPVRLLKEYVFKRDDREVGSPPAQDAADTLRRAARQCLSHVSGGKAPDYPRIALRAGQAGNVVAVLDFRSPADPPTARIYARESVHWLERHIAEWVKGYRLPCLSGERVGLTLTFTFRFQGDPLVGLRPLTLQELLPHVKGIRTRALVLDSTAAGCPFDVTFTFLQPRARNIVWALGEWRPGREPIIDLLRGADLDLPDRSLDAAYGDTTTITVPCLKIDLKP